MPSGKNDERLLSDVAIAGGEQLLPDEINELMKASGLMEAAGEAASRLTGQGAKLVVRAVRAVRRDGREVLLVAFEHVPCPYPPLAVLRAQFRLTPQEARVALLLADRHSTEEIAETLCITWNTARCHIERVLTKLGVRRRRFVRQALLAL